MLNLDGVECDGGNKILCDITSFISLCAICDCLVVI